MALLLEVQKFGGVLAYYTVVIYSFNRKLGKPARLYHKLRVKVARILNPSSCFPSLHSQLPQYQTTIHLRNPFNSLQSGHLLHYYLTLHIEQNFYHKSPETELFMSIENLKTFGKCL